MGKIFDNLKDEFPQHQLLHVVRLHSEKKPDDSLVLNLDKVIKFCAEVILVQSKTMQMSAFMEQWKEMYVPIGCAYLKKNN